MKTILAVTALAVLLLVGGSLWSRSLQKSDDLVSSSGLHWHPRLSIFVKGKEVPIPANIGVGLSYAGLPTYDGKMRMTAIHTHDDMPVIHLEFPGLVRQEDLTLGNFFRIWGKDMRSFGLNMRMTVNGIENVEYENYMMRDEDVIELRYE